MPQASAVVEIVRCRIFETGVHALFGEPIFSEVWDTLEHPYPADDMPSGEQKMEFKGEPGKDMKQQGKDIRHRVDTYRREKGIRFGGDWAGRGSI